MVCMVLEIMWELPWAVSGIVEITLNAVANASGYDDMPLID